MSDVAIGDLRHRLMLEAPVRTGDGAGGASLTWSLVAEVWGAIRPQSGSESADAEALRGRVTHEIWIRHKGGVGPDMRFRLGSRVFDIRAAIDVGERHRFLKCLVEERVA